MIAKVKNLWSANLDFPPGEMELHHVTGKYSEYREVFKPSDLGDEGQVAFSTSNVPSNLREVELCVKKVGLKIERMASMILLLRYPEKARQPEKTATDVFATAIKESKMVARSTTPAAAAPARSTTTSTHQKIDSAAANKKSSSSSSSANNEPTTVAAAAIAAPRTHLPKSDYVKLKESMSSSTNNKTCAAPKESSSNNAAAATTAERKKELKKVPMPSANKSEKKRRGEAADKAKGGQEEDRWPGGGDEKTTPPRPNKNARRQSQERENEDRAESVRYREFMASQRSLLPPDTPASGDTGHENNTASQPRQMRRGSGAAGLTSPSPPAGRKILPQPSPQDLRSATPAFLVGWGSPAAAVQDDDDEDQQEEEEEEEEEVLGTTPVPANGGGFSFPVTKRGGEEDWSPLSRIY